MIYGIFSVSNQVETTVQKCNNFGNLKPQWHQIPSVVLRLLDVERIQWLRRGMMFTSNDYVLLYLQIPHYRIFITNV